MRLNKFIFFCLLSLCTYSNAEVLPPVGDDNHIHFKADSFDYNKDADTVILKGNVRVTEKNRPDGLAERIMTAEEFVIHPQSGIMKTPGAVVVEENLNAIFGEKGVFNRNTGEGSLNNVSAAYDSWRITKANEAVLKNDKHIYKKVTLTSCSLEKPHYHLNFSKISVIPKKRIFGYNGLLFFKGFPVFYFPFMYQTLGTDKKYITYVDLGYDERSGGQIKTTTVYSFDNGMLGKFYLDYFTRLSFGTGLGFSTPKENKLNLDIDGYRIKESGSSVERWGLAGGYNFNIKDTLSESKTGDGYNLYSQSQFRLVSDPFFNNDFFRSNPYAVSPDNKADISLVKQTKKTVTRLSYIRNQTRLNNDNFFTTTEESRPKLEFSTTPFKVLNSPFLNIFESSFESVKTNETGYYKKTARGKYTINKTVPVVKGVSLLPSTFYDQEIIFSPKKADGSGYAQNQFIGRWGTDVNLRTYTKFVITDITHSYTKRLKPNKLTADINADDFGTEKNLVSVSNFIRPNRKVYVRFNTGFDLRDIKTQKQDFSSRVEPLFIDVYYRATNEFALSLQDKYKPSRGNEYILMQSTLGNEEKTHFTVGFSNFKTNPSNYLLNTSFYWKPYKKSWNLELGAGVKAHLNSASSLKDFSLYSKKIGFYKEFHDIFSQWVLRLRPGVKEFSFNLGLKFNRRKSRIKSEKEKERFSSESVVKQDFYKKTHI